MTLQDFHVEGMEEDPDERLWSQENVREEDYDHMDTEETGPYHGADRHAMELDSGPSVRSRTVSLYLDADPFCVIGTG